MTRIFAVLLLFASTIFLTACPEQTTIARLQSDPGRYRNKEVVVIGNVGRSYGALGRGAFELKDETGSLWVITERGVPTKGARVASVGRFINGVTWEGRNFGSALQETDRRFRDGR